MAHITSCLKKIPADGERDRGTWNEPGRHNEEFLAVREARKAIV